MMRGHTLVTGAAGLIGNAVCRKLLSSGQPVIAIDRSVSHTDGLDVLECDVNDIHQLHAIARRHQISGIVHCGALSGPMVAADNPPLMVGINIVGTANMLELARQMGNVRLVFCSSTSAVGPTGPGPHNEDIVLRPSTVYGASKAASEHLVQAFRRQHGVDGVALRISWVYGPRRTTSCAIRQMITDALAGHKTHLPFGRDFPRQYVHVDDVASGLIAALNRRELPRTEYFLTGGTWLKLGEIAGIVSSIMPQARIAVEDGADPVDDWQGPFDISNAARDLSYKPRISLEQGIAAYRDWLASQ
jgi:nucleoside-diphosphate-sugar epimerase